MKKMYHYAALLLTAESMEKKYFVISSDILTNNEGEMIHLFVEANEFNEDDADNCVSAVRLTDSQYKAVMGK